MIGRETVWTDERRDPRAGERRSASPSSRCPGLRSASVGIFLTAGGRHERVEQNGIAHFLEHMAFKGTPTRTARRIAEEIEDVGGYINAYTGKEMTAYYARVLEADVGRALDILADIVLNPLFSEPDIEVERGVILQEIGQALDTPDDIIFDWLQEAAFPDQPFGRTILGPAERVSALRQAGSRRLRRRALRPGPDDRRRRRRRRSRGLPATSSGSSAICAPRRASPVAAGALRRRRAARGARPRAGAHGPGLRGAGRPRRRRLRRAALRDRAGRRHVLAAVPGAARAARPLLHHLRPGRRLRRHRADHPLCRHRRRPDPRARPSSPWTSCAAPPTA